MFSFLKNYQILEEENFFFTLLGYLAGLLIKLT